MSDPIKQVTLQEGDHQVSLLSYGARLQSWRVAYRGAELPVVLGYDELSDYLTDTASMGVLAGRVANRISGAAFTLDGDTHHIIANEGTKALHGGSLGFGQRHWALERDGPQAAELRLTSDHGDMGFPGRLEIRVRVTLSCGRLTYEITGQTDRPTPVNIAHHAYWNLMGGGDILDHVVKVEANRWTPTDADLIPTGAIAPLDTRLATLRAGLPIRDTGAQGFDMNYVLDQGLACVTAPNGLSLTVETDQPCLQFYTGHKLGRPFRPFGGLCLEPQGYVDALNAGFPASIATPDKPYRQHSSFTVGPA